MQIVPFISSFIAIVFFLSSYTDINCNYFVYFVKLFVKTVYILALTGIFFMSLLNERIIGENEPKAIDVYNGLTELKITKVNDMPTDTIVVFKNLKNEN